MTGRSTPARRSLLAAGLAAASTPLVASAAHAAPSGRDASGAVRTWTRLPDLPPNRVDWHPAIPVSGRGWPATNPPIRQE